MPRFKTNWFKNTFIIFLCLKATNLYFKVFKFCSLYHDSFLAAYLSLAFFSSFFFKIDQLMIRFLQYNF